MKKIIKWNFTNFTNFISISNKSSKAQANETLNRLSEYYNQMSSGLAKAGILLDKAQANQIFNHLSKLHMQVSSGKAKVPQNIWLPIFRNWFHLLWKIRHHFRLSRALRVHSFNTYGKCSENLTFHTPIYAHVRVHIGGVRNVNFSQHFVYVLNEWSQTSL